MRQHLNTLVAFGVKVNNDWIFNLAGLLAYNILMASFPLFFVALSLAGFSLGAIDPADQAALLRNVASALPAGTGDILVHATTDNLQRNAGFLLVLGLITSIFLGSRLFITLEDCFGIVFRLRPRTIVRQNVMAVVLLFVIVALIPLFFFLSLVPKEVLRLLPAVERDVGTVLAAIFQFGGGIIVTFALLLLILTVVPNRRPEWRYCWPGAVLATGLVTLYLRVFPFYTAVFLRPENFGSIAVFAIVILLFYYFFAFILLIGAELNSWISGQRATRGDLPTILYLLQTNATTTASAASPTETLPAASQPKAK